MDKLFALGARLIMFDIVFNSPADADPAFHAALEKYRDRVVIASNFDDQHNYQLVLPSKTLISAPQGQDDRVGFVNYWDDLDGVIRRAPFHVSDRQLAGEAEFAGREFFLSMVAPPFLNLHLPHPLP